MQPYTWTVTAGDINHINEETISYLAPNVRGKYEITLQDNTGKQAQALVNVYSTRLFSSPKLLYINKGETLKIMIGGGTGNYILTSQFGKLAHNKLTLDQNKRSITTEYTAPQNYEGRDSIHILDTAGNLGNIKVEIAKKEDVIAMYADSNGKIDNTGMGLAIDDFFAGQSWLDRVTMFQIIEKFLID